MARLEDLQVLGFYDSVDPRDRMTKPIGKPADDPKDEHTAAPDLGFGILLADERSPPAQPVSSPKD